jgi:hypothetical protein
MFSLSKGIREVLEEGALTGVEREFHCMLEREAESDLNEAKWLRGGNPRPQLRVPASRMSRDARTCAATRG